MRKVLLFITTTAVVAGMTGTASAESLTATSLVQEGNANCGKYESGEPIIGSAKFTRTFNKLKVTYKAKHLAKTTFYNLEVYNATAGACEHLAAVADFETNAKGVGSATGELEVAEGDYEFFVSAYDLGVAPPINNNSFIVVLPRP